MKKHFILSFAAAAALCCACSQESVLSPNQAQEIVISAYSGDAAVSRTSIDEYGKFYWSPGDQISLFYGYGENGGSQFTSLNWEKAPAADFTGSINIVTGSFENEGEGMFWGVYPYNENNICTGSSVITEVPAKQYAAEGTFSDGQFVSIGRSPGLSMGFYHLCGGIWFYLQNPGITRIELTGNMPEFNKEYLAGKVEVEIDDEKHPYVSNFIEPSTSVTLYPPKGEEFFNTGVKYLLVTLPVEFENGFSVTFYKEQESLVGIRRIESSMAVHRALFQWSDKPIDIDVDFTLDYSEDVEYFDIENAGTRQFLEEVDYSDDPDYTYSKVGQFPGDDEPNPVEIYWDGTASYIQLSTSEFFMDVTEIPVSSSPALIYNLVPGVNYYYRVISDNGQLLKESCAMPIGPMRMIHGVTKNIRDLGGWKAKSYDKEYGYEITKSIKYGRLYRGGTIDNISSSGLEILQQDLGVTMDLDLRGKYESNHQNFDCNYVNIPVPEYLGVTSSSSSSIEEGSTLNRNAIREIINWLYQDRGSIYFHCTYGADRTGTLAFLIEALLGVSESDLSKDYELTYYADLSSRTRINNGFKRMIQYLKSFNGSTINECVEKWAMSGSNALTEEDIEMLRSLLLE